jgi:DNA repair exonuclease SbcCD ATPase subunit
MNTQTYRTKLERLKGNKEATQKRVEQSKLAIRKHQIKMINAEYALTLLQQAAKMTQQKLEYKISEIGSLALSSIFPEPYTLKIDFTSDGKSKTKCNITFELNNKTVDPLTASGGGAVIVTAFALRIALWNLQRPKSRAVIIMDEPFKFINGEEYQQKASRLLVEISNKLGIQFIIVSQDKNLGEAAHKLFEVKKIKGVSQVKVLQEND